MSATIKPAPIWRRLTALCYDLFILVAISFAYSASLTAIAAAMGNHAHQDYSPMFHSGWFFVGWILCLCAYYCWCWRNSGQTIGMKTWKIQVSPAFQSQQSRSPQTQSQQTMGIGWKQCFIRCAVSPLAILLLGIGFWYALFNDQKRSLQDRLSGTWTTLVN